MEKINVEYKSGTGRYTPRWVDYMIAEVGGTQLYAEMFSDDEDEIETWREGTYEELKKELLIQAEEKGINPKTLRFWLDK